MCELDSAPNRYDLKYSGLISEIPSNPLFIMRPRLLAEFWQASKHVFSISLLKGSP